MDDSRQEILTKLKFLARVDRGEKINIRDMSLQNESWFTTVSRTFWSVDNRNNTMNFIQNTITSAFNLIVLLLKSDTVGDKQICKTIIEDIIRSKKGISTLKTTYAEDTYFCCGIDTYIQMIDAHIAQLKSGYPEIFNGIDENPSQGVFKSDGSSSLSTSSPSLLPIPQPSIPVLQEPQKQSEQKQSEHEEEDEEDKRQTLPKSEYVNDKKKGKGK